MCAYSGAIIDWPGPTGKRWIIQRIKNPERGGFGAPVSSNFYHFRRCACHHASCAACRVSMVMGEKKAIHILDLMFGGPWNALSEFPGIEGSRESRGNRRKAKKVIERLLS